MSILESARKLAEKEKKNKEYAGNTKSTTTQKSNTTSTKTTKTKENKTTSTEKPTSILESARKLAEKEGKSRATISSTPTSTKKYTDYSSAVKYLQGKGVQGASGIMTENEWRRRNKSGGTYQDYLDTAISKFENGTIASQATNPTVKKSTGEKWLDSAGYIGEKFGRGIIDGLEGVTDFAWSIPLSLGWAITSGAGFFDNSVENWFEKQYNQINNDDITNYFGNAEERYDAAPEWVKDWGWLPETIGNILPTMAETYFTGGASSADDLVAAGGSLVDDVSKAGASLWDDIVKAGKNAVDDVARTVTNPKKLLTNPDVHFGMSAGGNAIETAIEKGANPLTSTTYGSSIGAVEALSEKLFGTGYAGTSIGASKRVAKEAAEETAEKTLLKKIWNSPVTKNVLDIGTEWLEEDISAFADPVLQRTIGVDANAEWASWSDYVESGSHGAILSVVMKALGVPSRMIAKHGKNKAISNINESAEVLNGLIQDDTMKLQPLPNNATEEEIVARQKEITAVALAYDNAVKKAVQKEQQATTEQPIEEQDTLEKAAIDVVANRNDTQADKNEPVSKVFDTGNITPIKEETELKTKNKPSYDVVTNRSPLEVAKQEAETKATKAAFEAGRQNVPREKVNLETPEQEEAYNNGRIEHIKNMPKETPKVTNIDNETKQTYNVSGKMTDKTKNALDKKAPRRVVGTIDGRAYISDGKIAIPIEETDVEYAKSEWGLADNENIARVVEETANNNEYVPISTNPIEGKSTSVGTLYMFTTDDGRQIAIQKKYAKYFDGYNLSATFVKGTPYAIKATDVNGNFAGLVMAVRPMSSNGYELTDTKDVSMKSFKNKPITNVTKTEAANVIKAEKQQENTETPTVAQENKADVQTEKKEVQTSNTETGNAQDKIANDVIKYLNKGTDFNSARLFEIADKAYGGTMAEGKYTVKDAYDGMELAVNRYLMSADFVKEANGDAKTATKTVNKLIDLLTHIPTQTKRTAEQESYQQFSTPPNIAYLAAWVANINNSDVVLEPSAGIGGLALWGKAWGATVYANELSTRRLAFLNELGLDGTFNLNAEQIDNLLPDNIKPSVVVMNPPFSATAGRMSKNNTANAKRHVEQALERLEPNGRLVAILGNGMADDAPSFKTWWNDLKSEYNVRANIRIDGSNYRKYGTTFDVQLAIIDKTGPNTEQTITGTYKDLSEIPKLLEGIRNDRQTVVRDSNVGIERDTTTGNDTKRVTGLEHSDGSTSDVLGEQRKSEDSLRTLDGERTTKRDGTRNNRAEGDSKPVRSNTESKDTSRVKHPC